MLLRKKIHLAALTESSYWHKVKEKAGASAEVCGLILDWRGAWAKKSWKTLSRNGFNSGFMETLSFKVLRLSKWIHRCIYSRTDA